MTDLNIFKTKDFLSALKELFTGLNIPVNYIDDKSALPEDVLGPNYKPANDSHKLIKDIFILGLVDDAAFKGEKSVELSYIKNDYEGILIFGVELKNRSNGLLPARGQLAEITRAFNREFKHLPVVVVYRYDSYITIANAERMKYDQKWREGEKIGKVILIKDINVEKTHRAHIDILDDLKVKAKVNDFKSLNEHWLKVLNSSELNKKFYQELSNWYFWALDNVSFPDDIEKNKDVRNATNLIRLITRVIFIWFIKEKNLVPDSLFDEEYISKILKEYKKDKSSVYYQAILQNMFFGTLNQKMNERKFAQNGNITVNRNEYGIKNLYRYQEMFNLPENDIIKLFADIPFLNGGLFDCLDKMDGDGVTLYMDGFSRNPKKRAQVQDFLFFCSENEYDLNQIYGTKNKKYKVRGLIDILNSYKFTIAENTPIEEEVALDPELLGKVFENLLASYNPETQTTARKQTGSFYTPREIVNYMVDESLKEYLKQNLKDKLKIENDDAEIGLEIIFNYVEKDHAYTDKERKVLINAIDNCKILDPACGSGAFPMGVLHKLVYILNKLDPGNELWKDRQIEKINVDDPNLKEKMVADVNEAFMNNELDFGRKLYLIENCIYGVDIQPIAIQISKLRFFISLIVDQKVDKTKENRGIRSLPNLETKFVAANTLIGLDKPQQQLLHNPEIDDLEDEIKKNRHNYFGANTRKQKLDCQKKDKELREKISKLLEEEGWSHKTSEQIVAFDPYDQNISSPFFDPEWMYGIKEGFDVVIGNPPWGQKSVKFTKEEIVYLKAQYPSTKSGIMDICRPFIDIGVALLKNNGLFSYILPDIILLKSYDSTRKYIIDNLCLLRIDHWGMAFDNVNLESCTIIGIKNRGERNNTVTCEIHNKKNEINNIIQASFYENTGYKFNLSLSDEKNRILDKLKIAKKFSDLFECHEGIHSGNIREKLFIDTRINKNCHKLIVGREEVSSYRLLWSGKWVNYDKNIINKLNREYAGLGKMEYFTQPKLVVRRTGDFILSALDEDGFFFSNNVFVCIPKKDTNVSLRYILGILNSSISTWYYRTVQPRAGKLFAELKLNVLNEIPIALTTPDIEVKVANIVTRLIELKAKSNSDSEQIENELDNTILKIYGLSKQERELIMKTKNG